ncbi:hypothetical protein F5Y00DRAFT_266652 [Daldinia vernicosa]|uniref:uncharacterized protein n=1 Tax=Daldinia vernicosa TaxID=114800 RepID=UPI0020076634|nr:uncharacterized protein F5Y00DRAFT_266652 [Daldinia vernicosa]KAI0844329.1 hypothetical protein F5Y00DRAFT_266652 [Daldinia vernicosa]
MDSQGYAVARDGSKYTSKFFPPNPAVLNLANLANREPLMHLVQQTILYHVRNGNPLVRLWKDAYDAGYIEGSAAPYSQYLLAVRKMTGRMLNSEFNQEKTKTTVQVQSEIIKALAEELCYVGTPTVAEVKTESPSPVNLAQARFSPLAPEFSPEKSAVKSTSEEVQHTVEYKPSDARLASFEERCKKRGLRIASAKK